MGSQRVGHDSATKQQQQIPAVSVHTPSQAGPGARPGCERPPGKEAARGLLGVDSATGGFFWPVKSETPCSLPMIHTSISPSIQGLTRPQALQDTVRAQIPTSQHEWSRSLSWDLDHRDSLCGPLPPPPPHRPCLPRRPRSLPPGALLRHLLKPFTGKTQLLYVWSGCPTSPRAPGSPPSWELCHVMRLPLSDAL